MRNLLTFIKTLSMEIIFHSFIGAFIALFFKVLYDITIRAHKTNTNRKIIIAYLKNIGLDKCKEMLTEYNRLSIICGALDYNRTKELIQESQFDAFPMLNTDMFRALKFSELRNLAISDEEFIVLNTFVHCFEHQLKFLPINLLWTYADNIIEHLDNDDTEKIDWENDDVHFRNCQAIKDIKKELRTSVKIGKERTANNIEAIESILLEYDKWSNLRWMLIYSFKA
jgi:hypothetical protein